MPRTAQLSTQPTVPDRLCVTIPLMAPVVPVIQTLTGPVEVDVDSRTGTLSAPALSMTRLLIDPMTDQPVQKWAGAPNADGSYMGGSTSPQDEHYDPTRKPNDFTEVGASGLAQYGGFVREEFLPQLQGDRGLKALREMFDNNAIVGSLVFAIQMLIRKVEWRVEPPVAASVEEIVDARIAERQRRAQQMQQAQQQQMMSQLQPQPPATAAGPGGAGPAPVKSGPVAPHAAGVNTPTAPHMPVTKRVRRLLGMEKSSGMMVGGIDATTPTDDAPTDPETGEAMEFAPGAGPTDLSPEARKGEELAVFVETCFHDMDTSWADTLAQIVTMIVFGFAYHEIVYKKRSGPNPDEPTKGSKYDDGWIGWAKLAGRAQETRFRWEFDDNGEVIGMWQMSPPKFKLKYIPLTKALLFRTTAYKGNPEGRSLFRSAFRSYHFAKRAEEYEAIGLERDLAGVPIAYVPYQMMTPSATSDEIAALEEIKKIVRNLRFNEQSGVVFPTAFDPETKQPLYKLELLSSPRKGAAQDTDRVISRYEQRMAMTVLADFILLGHENVGSKSLGETKADLFTTVLEALLNSIADIINTYAIPRLMQMNNEDPALSPKLTFGRLTQVSIEEMASVITALSGAGFVLAGDEQLEDYVRDFVGFPPKAASDDL